MGPTLGLYEIIMVKMEKLNWDRYNSHAMGSAPLLIYCLLRGIRVNISKLIISVMTSDSLLVPTRHLPFGMLITYLLKQLNFNLSNEQSVEPSVI